MKSCIIWPCQRYQKVCDNLQSDKNLNRIEKNTNFFISSLKSASSSPMSSPSVSSSLKSPYWERVGESKEERGRGSLLIFDIFGFDFACQTIQKEVINDQFNFAKLLLIEKALFFHHPLQNVLVSASIKF